MWLNPLPNNALQITEGGVCMVLTEDKQRTLGLELIKLGIITQQDMGLKVRDVYYYNEFERK